MTDTETPEGKTPEGETPESETPRGKRAYTLQDVAARAGVSRMAVSAVVNGTRSTVGVSAATRARILDALQALQYQPNAFARALRRKHTDTVGFYSGGSLLSTGDSVIREIFHGLVEGLAADGRDLLLYSSFYAHRSRSLEARVLSRKIDAVIALPSPGDEPLLQTLRGAHVPTVLLAEVAEGLRSVTASDADGARALADHLLSRGHRRILYRRAAAAGGSEQTRWESFCAAAAAGGAQVQTLRSDDPTDRLTRAEAQRLLAADRSDGPTAVVGWHDRSAVRALRFCLRHGLRVPEDIAIAGFDGVPDPEMPPGRRLTTVAAHWREVALAATRLVAAELAGEADLPLLTRIPADLQIGDTA